MNRITKGTKQQTKRIRYSHLSAFFNFIIANIDPDFQNPCSTPILRKMFKAKAIPAWEIIEKDVIDEIIFRTDKPRNRLILELMARGGMRIGEVLKLTPKDVNDRKLTLRTQKAEKRGSTCSSLRKWPTDSRRTSGTMTFSQMKESFRYVMKLPEQWSKRPAKRLDSAPASRFEAACSNICIPLRSSNRDCLKSDFAAREPFDHPDILGKSP